MRALPFLLFAVGLMAGAVTITEREAEAKRSPSRAEKAASAAHERLDKALQKRGLAFGDEIFVRIFKAESELELWMRHDRAERFELLKTYPICAYSGELGPKQQVGDEQAPEGFYAVSKKSLNPRSNYHLSFNIGYPNAYDRAHDRTGSLIMVHGDCVSIGCFAMTDEGIEEIYSLADAALAAGQTFFRVHAFPFRMSNKNMAAHAKSQWKDFWANLKEGYDHFEKHRVPPDVAVKDKKYVFRD